MTHREKQEGLDRSLILLVAPHIDVYTNDRLYVCDGLLELAVLRIDDILRFLRSQLHSQELVGFHYCFQLAWTLKPIEVEASVVREKGDTSKTKSSGSRK